MAGKAKRILRKKDFAFGGRYGITEWQKGKTQPGGLGSGYWFTGPPLRVLFDYCGANSDCKIMAHDVRRYRRYWNKYTVFSLKYR